MLQPIALIGLLLGSFLLLDSPPPSNARAHAHETTARPSTHALAPPSDARVTAVAPLPTGVALGTTLARYETRYRTHGRNRGRAHNVETAAAKLDGTIIAPGATLSFNETVGARTHANGFRRAMVIDSGELVPGMGGGVCQVASTLNAAALEGGLEIVASRPHSRPSGYIALGLDATVSYPELDLEISNPFDFPVLVEARAERGEMVVELVGQEQPLEVDLTRRVLSRSGYDQRLVPDPALALGTRVVTQDGIRGAQVRVTRTINEDGNTRRESRVVGYPATDEIVRVGTAAPSFLR